MRKQNKFQPKVGKNLELGDIFESSGNADKA